MKAAKLTAIILLISSVTAEAQWRTPRRSSPKPAPSANPSPSPAPSTSAPQVTKAQHDELVARLNALAQRVDNHDTKIDQLQKAPAPASPESFRASIASNYQVLEETGYHYPKLTVASNVANSFLSSGFTISNGVIHVAKKGVYSFNACASFSNNTSSTSIGGANLRIELGSSGSSVFPFHAAQSSNKYFYIPVGGESSLCTSSVFKLPTDNMRLRIHIYFTGNPGIDLLRPGTFLSGHRISDL